VTAMERRDFVRSAVAAGVAASGLPAFTAAASPRPKAPRTFKLRYAPHFGMFRQHAGEDLVAQLEFMRAEGFTALEDNGMMGRPVADQERIGQALQRLGMTMGVFVISAFRNGDVWATTGKKELIDQFVAGCRTAVDVAKRVNAKWMTVVPGNFERRLPIGVQTANVIDALRRGVEVLQPHGLVMVLEPLSDTPDLFLRTGDQAYEICRAVDSPSCKILYDMYHIQRNIGHIIPVMDLIWSETAYFQVGDNPGRKEPGTGEMNYQNIFKHIHSKKFDGVVGMEHGNAKPGREGERAVIDAYIAADAFPVT
jgi:hydroxypyruvate isomerase